MLPLSVIVPTHNTCELTLACVRSVVAAQGPEREIIVVDDGGSDDTSARLSTEVPAARVLRRPSAGGFAPAANDGLQQARGQILLLLNSDAILEPEALRAVWSAFEREPKLGVAGAKLSFPDGRPQWSGGPRPSPVWLGLMASDVMRLAPAGRPRGHRPASIDWVSGAAMALRRTMLEQIGLLDQRFGFYAQDIDLCLRARHAGWRVEIVEDFLARHHEGATIGSNSRRLALLWSDLVTCLRVHDGDRAARRAAWAMTAGSLVRRLIEPLTQRDRSGSGRVGEAARAARRAASDPLPSASIPQLAKEPSR